MLKSEMISIWQLQWKQEEGNWWAAEVKVLGLYYEVRQTRDGGSRFRTSLEPNRWRDYEGSVEDCMQAMQNDFEVRVLAVITGVKVPAPDTPDTPDRPEPLTGDVFELIRDVTVGECYWLSEDVKAGQRVHRYTGATYGVISAAGIAVTLEKNQTPFFELPRSALKQINS